MKKKKGKGKLKDRSLKAVISKIEQEKELIETIETKAFDQIKKKTQNKEE